MASGFGGGGSFGKPVGSSVLGVGKMEDKGLGK
eukprot:CAMPEP_0114580342 /NCGR_PEP_ID=MMETSP0125-20121206/4657_1 /TAXON_ID=485358 ORGANISM="Aristerostoma sp., Strain ATCC 50986" /NCGR_SAMPLE_ID=MMETSP0125 /ASSEMBLY_ACC=CAM_ASM_000245 /LENGTH=32 /DNA_ID= /DNA_START= /DNA_END= /DNA_ORIENTATION=